MNFLRKLFGASDRQDTPVVSPPTTVAVPKTPEAGDAIESGSDSPAAAKQSFPFAVGAASDKGMHRNHNEDALFCLQSVLETEAETVPFGLFVVADGLGGHADGQIASELAIRAIVSNVMKAVYVPAISGRAQNAETVPLNETFLRAVELANHSVREGTHGGGSTLTALVLIDRMAHIVHVGDSRAYLVCDDSVSQLTRDHSLGARLMEIQGLSEEEVSRLPERHTLYRALGQPIRPEPDVYYQSIPAGCHLMICSDGLWGSVSQGDILDAFKSSHDPHDICARMTDLAIAQGSDDNVSLIVLFSNEI